LTIPPLEKGPGGFEAGPWAARASPEHEAPGRKSPLTPLCQRGESGAPGQRILIGVISGAHPGMGPSFLTPHPTKFATDPKNARTTRSPWGPALSRAGAQPDLPRVPKTVAGRRVTHIAMSCVFIHRNHSSHTLSQSMIATSLRSTMDHTKYRVLPIPLRNSDHMGSIAMLVGAKATVGPFLPPFAKGGRGDLRRGG